MAVFRYYQIVREHVLQLIQSGALAPGSQLPSERTLCNELDLNRNTVRHALQLLQREGRIFRLERRGWYVSTRRLVYNPARHVNFARLAATQGFEARWTTTDNGVVEITPDMPEDGGFVQGTMVYEMENEFYLDNQKVAYVVSHLHAGRLKDIVPKTVSRALTQVVQEEYGISLLQRRLLIRPVLLHKQVTDMLGLSHGTPGLYVRRVKTDEDGAVLSLEQEYWRYDAIELRVDAE
ncbi:GntR family transcriptional regulator [Desulfovibrio subterraneus]|jgi:DNA-binding GntR family transcriptional regulator|uniref:UTRA domain-containing protein n=1 Tax=Desulfovibrio subterraneus TaxID=2718620 RepID=UPI0022B8AF87|nr:UTRA domain-containing protein [Desulfovibrio subterraneus]WBF67412.1 GntR family transcriptional regulator [Desulfovibrio subterraneus]